MYISTAFLALLSANGILAFDSNPWYGFSMSKPDGTRFTSVSTQFKVPKFTIGDEKNAKEWRLTAWAGIDGAWNDEGFVDQADVLQGGIEMYITPKGAGLSKPNVVDLRVAGWTEYWPSATEPTKDLQIDFGDTIQIEIKAPTPQDGTIAVNNLTKKITTIKQFKAFPKMKFGHTAEFIIETYSTADKKHIGAPNFGTIVFENCVAETEDGKRYGPDQMVIVDADNEMKSEVVNRNSIKFTWTPNIAS